MKPGDGEELRHSLLDGADGGGPDVPGEPAAAVPAPSGRGGRGRAVVRGIGEVFLTVGALMLLMVAYQLWWTNIESSQAIAAERDDIVQSWQDPVAQPTTPTDGPTPSASPTTAARPSYGTGFALLYIPRLRDKVWGLPIMQGTGKPILAKGAGHYRGTAMPGEVGNFAIAAHRSTHSEPFANFPDLQTGDKVYVQTRDTWYVYTLTKDDPNLSPTDTWVILPVPGEPGAKPTQKLITMTTCTPRYGSTGRWAWWGELSAEQPSSDGPPDGITGTA
jgi:sortase A